MLEQIKEVLLGRAQMFTAQMETVFDNSSGFLGSGPGRSIVAGASWYDKPVEVEVDGIVVYEGLIRKIVGDDETGTARVVSENVFARPTNAVCNFLATEANPGAVLLGIARQAMPDTMLDVDSFFSAGAAAQQADARIEAAFVPGEKTTVAEAIQKVGALCSISVFVYRNILRAEAFVPYQGDGSGLAFPIDDQIVRQWGESTWDVESFNNRVRVGYDVGPPELYVEDEDEESLRENGADDPREQQFSAGDQVRASDEQSARYFGRLYLSRASYKRRIVSVVGGPELRNVRLGQRFPVTQPREGLSDVPVEAIEVRPRLGQDEGELLLAGLRRPR